MTMYELPYGNTQQLNLDWFIQRWKEFYEEWEQTKTEIDGALDEEVQKVEDAMEDLYAARDAAAASATAAAASAASASNDATIAANAATAAAASATLANTKAAAAGLSEAAAALSASQAANDATAAATSASQASASASSATDSAQAAATSEQNIESIIEDAIQDATDAAVAEATADAEAAATAAASSASDAADSATAAAASATAADSSADDAADSATAAAGSATAAAGSASDAADSATAAAASAASIVVDSAMSDSSTNPVQNKVINGELTQLKTATTQNTEWLIKSTPDADVKRINPNISNLSVNGATATYSNGKLAVYGTCNATRYILCLDSQAVAKSGSGTFEKTLDAGEYYISFKASGNIPSEYTPLVRYSKSTFTANRTDVYDNEIIKVNEPVMLAITIQAGNYGTSENPTLFELEVFNINEPSIKSINILSPTNDTTNRTDEILACLNKYGICRLAEGDYYITRFKLPDNVALIGGGKNKTRLISTTDATSAYILSAGVNSTISDLTLEYYTESDPTPTATYKDALHGIVIGTTASTDTSTYNVSIENVEVKKMPGCGIFLRRIGSGNNGSTIRNVKTTLCSVGFYIGTNAEYNTLIDCYATRCYTGMIIMGGNNIVSESIVSECEHGFVFDKTDDYGSASNGGHSIITGCKISHVGYYDNNGLCVKSEGLANSQLISNCMMTTNISVKDAEQPLQFVGCQFRSNNNITIDNSIVSTMSCVFYSGTNTGITILNDGILKRVGSIDFSGNLLSDVSS